jgi:cyclohexa-1,5-dienecarbonyl-CoA hydratase
LNRPKANVIDKEMICALNKALAHHVDNGKLLGVILDHAGPHFSFGASIQEHFPEEAPAMLASLHGLLKQMIAYPCPILVCVKGQCLGGGLEVALAGNLIFAASDAMLGQPEIKLAVFAPAASCLLPARVSQPVAEDILFSGRSVTAEQALQMGVIDNLSDDPLAAAMTYFDKHLANHSAAALRFAVQAAREVYVARVSQDLDRVESICLNGLMKTKDAIEGLTAFVEKRSPIWQHK